MSEWVSAKASPSHFDWAHTIRASLFSIYLHTHNHNVVRQIFADAKVHSSIILIESFLLVRCVCFFSHHLSIRTRARVLELKENILAACAMCIVQFLALAIVNMANCIRFYRSFIISSVNEFVRARTHTHKRSKFPFHWTAFQLSLLTIKHKQNMKSDGYFNQHVFALWILIGRKISSIRASGILYLYAICKLVNEQRAGQSEWEVQTQLENGRE